VTLHLQTAPQPQVPVNALVVRDNKQYVAVPDGNDVVHFHEVEVAETQGGVVSIANGLKSGEKVALNVPDDVSDGSHIQPVPAVQ
jgi:hypothetical protein